MEFIPLAVVAVEAEEVDISIAKDAEEDVEEEADKSEEGTTE